MSSFNANKTASRSSHDSHLDHLFLQTLINRLQVRPPTPKTTPLNLNSKTLDDLLLDAIANLSSSSSSSSDNDEDPKVNSRKDSTSHKSLLAKEESKLEKQLIRLIRAGDMQTLKPNSGQAVSIGEHHICVGNHVESGSDYKVWEWHGHIMLFDEESGYMPEYIYGNYFERLTRVNKGKKKEKEKEVLVVEKVEVEEEEEEEEEKPVKLGLKELIGGGEAAGGRVVHRGVNSTR